MKNIRQSFRPESLSAALVWACLIGVLTCITYLGATTPWIAVIALVALVSLVLFWQEPQAVVGAFIIPLIVGEQALAVLIVQEQGNALQKLALIAVAMLCALFFGPARPPLAVTLLIGLFLALLANSLLNINNPPQTTAGYITSTAGYMVPWLIFCINWKAIPPDVPLRVISLVPLAALCLSLLLDSVGIIPLFTSGSFDISRLGGTLPPAYLGASAAFGAIASFWLWLRHRRGAFLTLVFSVLVAAASATRAPVVVAFFVILCLLLFTRRVRTRISGTIRVLVLVGLSAGGWFIAPTLIERTTEQDQYHGGGLSGRNLAWDYFWGRFLERPWTGHGPGSNAVLSQESSVQLVRDYFVAPHNTYLQLLVDFGIVGALLVVALIVFLFVQIARKAGHREKVLVVALGCAMIFYAFFDNVLAAPQIYTPMAMILASFNGISSETTPIVVKDVGLPSR